MSRRLFGVILVFILLGACAILPASFPLRQKPLLGRDYTPDTFFSSLAWPEKDLLTLEGLSTKDPMYPFFIGNISTGRVIPVLVNHQVVSGASPRISPDGRYIAFTEPLNQERDTIQLASLPDDLDKAESLDVTGQLLDVTGKSLAWSADSSELAILTLDWLEAEERTILHIYRYRLSEKRSTKIFEYDDKNMGFVDSLSWSSDGKKLAFSIEYQQSPEQVDLFVFRLDDGTLTRLTSTSAFEQFPAWYPKGDLLVYTLTSQSGSPLFDSKLVFSTSDGACSKVLPGITGIQSPAWSPDGTQIAYMTDEGVKFLDVAKDVPPAFLSPESLCKPGH